jgi:hypothetical protein
LLQESLQSGGREKSPCLLQAQLLSTGSEKAPCLLQEPLPSEGSEKSPKRLLRSNIFKKKCDLFSLQANIHFIVNLADQVLTMG